MDIPKTEKEVHDDVEFVLIGAGQIVLIKKTWDTGACVRTTEDRDPLHLHGPGEAAARQMSPHGQGHTGGYWST